MAAAVFAAAATIGAEAIGFAFAAAGTTWSWGSVLAKAAFSAGMSLIASGLSERRQEAPSFTSEARARTQMIRASTEPRRVIYGTAQASGVLVYATSTGDKKQFLHLVIAVAGHRVHAIGDVILNDETVGALDGAGMVSAGRFAGKVRIKKHLGAVDQVPDADLNAESAEWAAKYRPLRGIAYLYVRLEWDRDVFPTGIPNVKAIVDGKDTIFDPRTGLAGYSDNAALCQLDYIRWAYGMRCTADEVDDDTWIAAANVCDETVALPGGGTQKRYTCNGTFTLDRNPGDVLLELRSASAGALIYRMGKWYGYAGAADVATQTLTADDLRGPLKVRTLRPRAELFNAVRGTFTNPDDHWQATDFPQVTNALYEAQDGGERITRDVQLPYTDDVYAAQRIAKIELERHRQQITGTFPAKLKGLRIVPWRPVKIDIGLLGWEEKLFRITKWKLAEDGGVDLDYEEYAPEIYDWNFGEATVVDPAPNTNLPNPFDVAAPRHLTVAESLYVTRDGAGVKARAELTWTPPADAFVYQYEVQVKPAADAEWRTVVGVPDARATLDDIAPGVWDFRVRARNSLGVAGGWVSLRAAIVGLGAAPAAVTGLQLAASGGSAILRWAAHPDLDVRIGGFIEFRHSNAISGATWANSVGIGAAISGSATSAVLPLLPGTYLARAVDSSGIYAETVASVVTSAPIVAGYVEWLTASDVPAWGGTHSGTAASAGILRLAESGGAVASSGTYTLVDSIDLGAVETVRLRVTREVGVYNAHDTLDARTTNMDSWSSFDGADPMGADCQVWEQHTNDDPAGSPAWSDWQRLDATEATARAWQFQVRLTSRDASINIAVSDLSIAADRAVSDGGTW